MARRLSLTAVRPTQLYISKAKLRDVLAWFDVDDPTYDPLPVFTYDDEWYLADGHTRGLVAALAGADTLRVERDRALRQTAEFAVYRQAIEWCVDAGIETVRDLYGRVVDPDTDQRRWIDRCQRVSATEDATADDPEH